MQSNETHGAVEQLHDALSADDVETKNFHIRQALQFLQVEGSNPSE